MFAGDVLHNIKSWTSAAFRKMYEDALITKDKKRGREWKIEKLLQDHPLYHCFFDFDSLPIGFDDWNVVRDGQHQYGVPYAVYYMDGVILDGRLIGLMDYKGYVDCWAWWNTIDGPRRFSNPRDVYDGTRQYQLGVNIILFVLSQEGSITKRVMDTVGY